MEATQLSTTLALAPEVTHWWGLAYRNDTSLTRETPSVLPASSEGSQPTTFTPSEEHFPPTTKVSVGIIKKKKKKKNQKLQIKYSPKIRKFFFKQIRIC